MALLSAHLGPAFTAVAPLRRALCPALAGHGEPGRVALTFDDGPDPASTPMFLDVLAELDVRATFFVLGQMLADSPAMGRRLVEEGHEVALHGWGHRPLVLRSSRAVATDLTRARDEVLRRCGVTPTWWRPPYGVLSGGSLLAARRLGLQPVLWTAWGRDWERRATAATVRTHVARHLGPGGTVLLHDSDCTSAPGSWRTTLAALPDVIGDVRRMGLVPGPLSEHRQPVRSLTGPSPDASAHDDCFPGHRPRDAQQGSGGDGLLLDHQDPLHHRR